MSCPDSVQENCWQKIESWQADYMLGRAELRGGNLAKKPDSKPRHFHARKKKVGRRPTVVHSSARARNSDDTEMSRLH